MLKLNISKMLRLVPIAVTRPAEFYDRVNAVVQVTKIAGGVAKYSATDMHGALKSLEDATGLEIRSHLDEAPLSDIDSAVKLAWTKLEGNRSFLHTHNADEFLARTCYSIVSALQPKTVIETGVCYGVTSAFMLQALQANGAGRLHSIDLPPLAKDAKRYVGILVPDRLRSRGTLHRGSSQRLLPPLVKKLKKLGEIDLFLHDSLHTYQHMKMEFETAWAALRPGGMLIADDIQGNAAFLEHSALPDVRTSVVMKFADGDALFGVAVKS